MLYTLGSKALIRYRMNYQSHSSMERNHVGVMHNNVFVLTIWIKKENEHTIMTTPLPVSSANLSVIRPG
jgi:hypothetical protein